MSETQLSAAIRGALNLRPGVYVMRVNSGGYRGRMAGAPAGTPDIVGWCSFRWGGVDIMPQARFFALEVKVGKASLSAAQVAFARRARDAGAFVACVRSVEDAMGALDRAQRGEAK